mmetsp:Transcript_16292/g.28633  ORF Transcript_16292/g.28633 Transcript_16292/m.28633 type:complete len:103 (+) Transcript_16292:304-612(+)
MKLKMKTATYDCTLKAVAAAALFVVTTTATTTIIPLVNFQHFVFSFSFLASPSVLPSSIKYIYSSSMLFFQRQCFFFFFNISLFFGTKKTAPSAYYTQFYEN